MRTSRPGPLWWLLGFLALTALAASGAAIPVDRAVSHALEAIGHREPWLNAIWILGGVPLTGLVVLVASLARRQWRWLGLFVGGLMLEVITKHWISTPLPKPVAEPLWMARIEALASPSPHAALAVIGQVLRLPARSTPSAALFKGSFFSGHVFRITFATGAVSRKLSYTTIAAALTAFLVVALGGHWLLDAAGAFLVAGGLLMLAPRPRPSR